MKALFKIPHLNEMEIKGIGFYFDYLVRCSKTDREIKKIPLIDEVIDLIEDAMPDLKTPNLFRKKMYDLQEELLQYQTIDESRIITNLLKKIISERSSCIFKTKNQGNGIENILVNNLKYWEYIIDDSIYDLICVDFIECLQYLNSFTYVAHFIITEYDDDFNGIDTFTDEMIMTDQIKDYWNYYEPNNDMTKSCKSEIILTFNKTQEIINISIPFEKLKHKQDFVDFLLDNEVRSEERRLDLCKISTSIILTKEQIENIGDDYDLFLSWYLECSGKFYFNEYE